MDTSKSYVFVVHLNTMFVLITNQKAGVIEQLKIYKTDGYHQENMSVTFIFIAWASFRNAMSTTCSRNTNHNVCHCKETREFL